MPSVTELSSYHTHFIIQQHNIVSLISIQYAGLASSSSFTLRDKDMSSASPPHKDPPVPLIPLLQAIQDLSGTKVIDNIVAIQYPLNLTG